MRSIVDIVLEEDEQIDEALLDVKKLPFIPCKATKGDVVFCVAVGNIFNIKKSRYAYQIEKKFKEMGIKMKTNFDEAQKVIKQSTTKLIYILYNVNNDDDNTYAMVCNSDIIVPLDKKIKLK